MKDTRIVNLINMLNDSNLKYGYIICSADIVDCIYMDKEFIDSVDKIERECGHYEIGRYAWVLDNVKIIEPIEAKGQLGIWNYNE